MCKINGQSIFKWMFATPLAVVDEFKRQKDKKKNTDVGSTSEEIKNTNVSDSETTEKTGTLTSKKTNKQDLSKLRIPLNTSNTGASVGTPSSIGLNLGG